MTYGLNSLYLLSARYGLPFDMTMSSVMPGSFFGSSSIFGGYPNFQAFSGGFNQNSLFGGNFGMQNLMAQCNQIQNQWSQMAFNMPMMSNNFFMSRTPNNYTRNNERNENTEKTDGSTTRSTSRPGNTVWAKMPPLGSYTPARRRRNDSNSEFIAELHPAMQEKTKELIRYCREEMGMNLKIGSGYRTRAQQRALKKDKPKLAADVSWHEFGRAVDVEINGGSDRDYARLGRYAISIGMRWGGDWDSNPKTPNRFSTERWHFEYQGR